MSMTQQDRGGSEEFTAEERFVLGKTTLGLVADFTSLEGYQENAKPVVSAAFLRRLILELIPNARIGMPGVRLRGARLQGDLDLGDCSGPDGGMPALTFEQCDLFDAINLSGARLSRLSIAGSRLRMLVGAGVRIDGDFVFDHVRPAPNGSSEGYAQIAMRAARIEGDVWGREAALRSPGGGAAALNLISAQIKGGVALDVGFCAQGSVLLADARIGGTLQCSGAHFDAPKAIALDVSNAQIGGNVFMSADGVRPFQSDGQVSISAAKIGGDVVLSGARLSNVGGRAFMAQGTDVGGSFVLHPAAQPFECTGQFSVLNARIAGSFEAIGAKFTHAGPYPALTGQNCTIGGNVLLRTEAGHRFQCKGQISLFGATISGNFECGGALFDNPGSFALVAQNLSVGGDLALRPMGDIRFEANGQLSVPGVKVGANFDLSGANLNNPNGVAVFGENAQIGGNLLIRDDGRFPFQSKGQLYFIGARVGNDVRLVRASIENLKPGAGPNELFALDFESAEVGGQFFAVRNDIVGTIGMRGAHVGRLDDDPLTGWGSDTTLLRLDDFTYDQLRIQRNVWIDRAKWLQRNTRTGKIGFLSVQRGSFSNQPWQTCISALERVGQHIDSRRLKRAAYADENRHRGRAIYVTPFILGSEERLRHVQFNDEYGARFREALGKWNFDETPDVPWSIFWTSVKLALVWPFVKVYCVIKQFFVWLFAEQAYGYGLSASRAAVTSALVWLIGWGGAELALSRGALIESQGPGAEVRVCTSISPPLYALDIAVPVLDLGQERECKPGAAPGSELSPGQRVSVGPWTFQWLQEVALWQWAKALYALLGATAIGFAILTWTGVFNPRAKAS